MTTELVARLIISGFVLGGFFAFFVWLYSLYLVHRSYYREIPYHFFSKNIPKAIFLGPIMVWLGFIIVKLCEWSNWF